VLQHISQNACELRNQGRGHNEAGKSTGIHLAMDTHFSIHPRPFPHFKVFYNTLVKWLGIFSNCLGGCQTQKLLADVHSLKNSNRGKILPSFSFLQLN